MSVSLVEALLAGILAVLVVAAIPACNVNFG